MDIKLEDLDPLDAVEVYETMLKLSEEEEENEEVNKFIKKAIQAGEGSLFFSNKKEQDDWLKKHKAVRI